MPQEPSALIAGKIARSDDDQAESVSGNLDLSALVIEPPLDSSMHAADREYVWLVEVGYGLIVLALSILDHEPMARIVGVYRQTPSHAIASRIADEPSRNDAVAEPVRRGSSRRCRLRKSHPSLCVSCSRYSLSNTLLIGGQEVRIDGSKRGTHSDGSLRVVYSAPVSFAMSALSTIRSRRSANNTISAASTGFS